MKNQELLEFDEAMKLVLPLIDEKIQFQVQFLFELRERILDSYGPDEPVETYALSDLLNNSEYNPEQIALLVTAIEASAMPELTVTAQNLDSLRAQLLVDHLLSDKPALT